VQIILRAFDLRRQTRKGNASLPIAIKKQAGV